MVGQVGCYGAADWLLRKTELINGKDVLEPIPNEEKKLGKGPGSRVPPRSGRYPSRLDNDLGLIRKLLSHNQLRQEPLSIFAERVKPRGLHHATSGSGTSRATSSKT